MRILERYVLREHLFPFLIGFSVVVFLLTLDFLFDLVDLAIGKGIPAGIVLELFALSMGWMLALAVPCAVLIAALATFGRLAQDNEIAAMRANGINLMRIIGAPLLAATLPDADGAAGATSGSPLVMFCWRVPYATVMPALRTRSMKGVMAGSIWPLHFGCVAQMSST